jgi:hypothetical protein
VERGRNTLCVSCSVQRQCVLRVQSCGLRGWLAPRRLSFPSFPFFFLCPDSSSLRPANRPRQRTFAHAPSTIPLSLPCRLCVCAAPVLPVCSGVCSSGAPCVAGVFALVAEADDRQAQAQPCSAAAVHRRNGALARCRQATQQGTGTGSSTEPLAPRGTRAGTAPPASFGRSFALV